MTWRVEAQAGSAAAFHARPLPEPPERTVWVFEVTAVAVVLGSTQPAGVVRPGAAAEVVRRRSGGGAVLLVPGDVAWVDVLVPRGDALWDDDVGRATHWLGHAWVRALAACGIGGAEVHTGPMVTSPWSKLVCFAGLGPGEVTIGDAKAVGISQRRTRSVARFQCAAYRRWDAAALVELLAEPRPSPGDLAGAAVSLGVSPGELTAALVDALPA